MKAILDEQNPGGWWKGQQYGTEAISFSTFTRNAIRILTWLKLNAEDR